MNLPSVLVVDDEPANRAFVRNVLASTWSVTEANDGMEALDAVRLALPDLVIMDLDMPAMDGRAATAALRTGSLRGSGVPILAYTASPLSDADLRKSGLDGRLPKPCSPEELHGAVAPWRPDGATERARHLGEVFGRGEIVRLATGLRQQLAEALERLDAGDGGLPAHRIAGVAGTLGFAAVSASWLRLSEGDESAREDARRDARVAIAGIDRDILRY